MQTDEGQTEHEQRARDFTNDPIGTLTREMGDLRGQVRSLGMTATRHNILRMRLRRYAVGLEGPGPQDDPKRIARDLLDMLSDR
jgi:hypothetical protein